MNYFKRSEFTCKCGCGANEVKQVLLAALDRARGEAGIPFIVESGTRCAVNNELSGGGPDSSHLSGLAADIRVRDSVSRMKVLAALIKTGFTRIGINRSTIHADCDESKDHGVAWHYYK